MFLKWNSLKSDFFGTKILKLTFSNALWAISYCFIPKAMFPNRFMVKTSVSSKSKAYLNKKSSFDKHFDEIWVVQRPTGLSIWGEIYNNTYIQQILQRLPLITLFLINKPNILITVIFNRKQCLILMSFAYLETEEN